MSSDKSLYVVIRIPKSASTSLETIVKSAFPEARLFDMVGAIYGDEKVSVIEKLRSLRKERRRIWKNYRCLSPDSAWNKIEKTARHGDIVSGHFGIDEIKINSIDKKLITLLRNPMSRLLSDYNYSRNGFYKRNAFQRSYHNGRLAAAGRYSFEGYLSFLKDNQEYYGRYMSHFVTGDGHVEDKLEFMRENYFSFGTVEKIDRFRQDFKKKTGVTTRPVLKNHTQQKTRLALSSREVSLIEQLCVEDIELYNAVDRFVA